RSPPPLPPPLLPPGRVKEMTRAAASFRWARVARASRARASHAAIDGFGSGSAETARPEATPTAMEASTSQACVTASAVVVVFDEDGQGNRVSTAAPSAKRLPMTFTRVDVHDTTKHHTAKLAKAEYGELGKIDIATALYTIAALAPPNTAAAAS